MAAGQLGKNMHYPKKISHFINNKEVFAKNAQFFDKVNPQNGKIIAKVTRGTKADVNSAITLAQSVYDLWSKTPIHQRAELIKKTAILIKERKEEIAEIVHQETGRSKKDAQSEAKSASEYGFYFSQEARWLFGSIYNSANPNRFAYMVRQPIGVCALYSPFNGPLSGMAKKIFAALLCGNTIILKSHEYTPYTGVWFAQTLKEAGLPTGVFAIVQGFGKEVGNDIASDPRVSLISFTGSVEAARSILKAGAGRIAKICLELGGKNPLVVCDDADINLAVKCAVDSAFIESGQRCAAASRIIIFDSVYDEFKEKMIEKTKSLKVGSGDEDDIPPIISQKRVEEIGQFVESAIKKGAKLLIGGSRLKGLQYKGGYFYQPTILEDVSPGAEISQKEVFGPVGVLYKVKNLDEAINLANNSEFGLTSAIHTNNMNRAKYFIDRVQVGVVRVNGPTHGSENHMPFGGVKLSGNGWREPGQNALDIYSEWKFVTYDYDPTKV